VRERKVKGPENQGKKNYHAPKCKKEKFNEGRGAGSLTNPRKGENSAKIKGACGTFE